ncbi:MAG: glycosyltransferase, partial [Bacteroidota bacterium]
ETDKLKYYSECASVIYPPTNEDYGYITLEAMLAAKAVISTTDSGGPLEFIKHRETGLIVEPTPESIASAMDELFEKPLFAEALGKSAAEHYQSLKINWNNVVQELLK